jgi:hypothetical protein
VAGALSCKDCPPGATCSAIEITEQPLPEDDPTTVPLTASLAAIFAGALAWLGRRRVRWRRAERDGTRDTALLVSYVPPKALSPGSQGTQLRLVEIEAQLARADTAPGERSLDDPAGAIGKCFDEVRIVLDEAAACASRTQLRAVVRCAGKDHKAAYAACHDIVVRDEGHAQLLEAAAAAAKLQSGHPRQTIGELYELQMQARRTLPAFEERMKGGVVAAFAARKTAKGKFAVKLHMSTPKQLYRCMEKMCLKGGSDRYTCFSVCDVARCIIACDNCSLMAEVLQALLTCPGVNVVRTKDRSNNLTSMNWMDIMMNLTLNSDASAHVCEVQIVHAKMLVARSELGGHEPYGKLRAANEILALRAAEPAAARRAWGFGSRSSSVHLRVAKPPRGAVPSGCAAADRVMAVAALPTVENPVQAQLPARSIARSHAPVTAGGANPHCTATKRADVAIMVEAGVAARGMAAAKARCGGDSVAAAKLVATAVEEALRGIAAGGGAGKQQEQQQAVFEAVV